VKRIKDWYHGKKTKPLVEQNGVPEVPLYIESTRSQPIEPQQIMVACAQSVGKQRDHNEDQILTLNLTMGGEKNNYPFGLFIVADGMGGQQLGEVASSTAVRTMAGYLTGKFLSYMLNPLNAMDESLQEVMRAAIQEAQRAVTQVAPGSGTTLTAALILGKQVTIGHVGDSRAYAVWANDRMESITRDHSLVRRLEELGQISSDEAVVHPSRNVLYRAVGQADTLEADIFTLPFPQPGYLLLCSDGLWSVVSDDDLFRIVNNSATLQNACQDMITSANNAGGPDNISAILVQLLG
jgi:serine/threonine protein phosphatase PrpC